MQVTHPCKASWHQNSLRMPCPLPQAGSKGAAGSPTQGGNFVNPSQSNKDLAGGQQQGIGPQPPANASTASTAGNTSMEPLPSSSPQPRPTPGPLRLSIGSESNQNKGPLRPQLAAYSMRHALPALTQGLDSVVHAISGLWLWQLKQTGQTGRN